VGSGGKRWQARISHDSKNHHLGTFATKPEAAFAYDKDARQYGQAKPLKYEDTDA
jgi:hypothetical protein